MENEESNEKAGDSWGIRENPCGKNWSGFLHRKKELEKQKTQRIPRDSVVSAGTC